MYNDLLNESSLNFSPYPFAHRKKRENIIHLIYHLLQEWHSYTLISVTGTSHVKYMASPFFDFYMTTCLVL